MKWHCVCGAENDLELTHCGTCKEEKIEKLFPAWQRAMRDPATDGRKYEEPTDRRRRRKNFTEL